MQKASLDSHSVSVTVSLVSHNRDTGLVAGHCPLQFEPGATKKGATKKGAAKKMKSRTRGPEPMLSFHATETKIFILLRICVRPLLPVSSPAADLPPVTARLAPPT